MSYEGSKQSHEQPGQASTPAPAAERAVAPSKRTLTSGLAPAAAAGAPLAASGAAAGPPAGSSAGPSAGAAAPVQRKADASVSSGRSELTDRWADTLMRPDLHPAPVQAVGNLARHGGDIHGLAEQGIAGSSTSLPYLDQIQQSFGNYDVSGIQAHVGGPAAQASNAMGAEAYASRGHVAFAGTPTLHTAAHEAAHYLQQQAGVQLAGGVGKVGDRYEQHANAVADRVVQGKPAGDLLAQFAPGSGASSGPVQAKAVQMSIKDDLRGAMDGWGTDEEGIYARLQRASQEELREVLNDAALMAELRDELSQSEMSRVLDMLQAPLADKLRLAMNGWGTDEDYIHRSLAQASAAELQAVANDDALVSELEGELSGEDLRRVLDRLSVPLARKLRYAIRGWGTDEQYIFDSIAAAPIAQVTAAAQDAALMADVDSDLSGAEQARMRGQMARRIHLEGGDAALAFSLLVSDDDGQRTQRLGQYGGIVEQRALCDAVIVAGTNLDHMVHAFEAYWGVDTGTDGGSTWTVATIQQVHAQCKVLPEQDVRSGGWRRLIVEPGTGGSMNGAGDFRVGAGAQGVGTQPYGVGTQLSASAAAGDTTITVQDPAVFQTGATIAMGARPSADVHAISSISGNTYTLDAALTTGYGSGTRVVPDSDTAVRDVGWLEAVVRHEIAHAVDNVVGASGFYALGEWWSGNDFDTWANAMGTPWATSDGSTISEDDKQAIKDAIVAAKDSGGGQAINIGLAADHAINRYWSLNVPVIQAANACISRGQRYWQNPEVVPTYSSKRFAVNLYYKNFQYYNETVHAQRVRSYAVFSPAEFFAEVYTVFYEEAGRVPDADLGRLVPVGTWRDWIRTNVHERGHAPTTSPAAGTSPSVGVKAGNPGM